MSLLRDLKDIRSTAGLGWIPHRLSLRKPRGPGYKAFFDSLWKTIGCHAFFATGNAKPRVESIDYVEFTNLLKGKEYRAALGLWYASIAEMENGTYKIVGKMLDEWHVVGYTAIPRPLRYFVRPFRPTWAYWKGDGYSRGPFAEYIPEKNMVFSRYYVKFRIGKAGRDFAERFWGFKAPLLTMEICHEFHLDQRLARVFAVGTAVPSQFYCLLTSPGEGQQSHDHDMLGLDYDGIEGVFKCEAANNEAKASFAKHLCDYRLEG